MCPLWATSLYVLQGSKFSRFCPDESKSFTRRSRLHSVYSRDRKHKRRTMWSHNTRSKDDLKFDLLRTGGYYSVYPTNIDRSFFFFLPHFPSFPRSTFRTVSIVRKGEGLASAVFISLGPHAVMAMTVGNYNNYLFYLWPQFSAQYGIYGMLLKWRNVW